MERAEEGHPDLLPPAKRPRVEPDLIQGTENARKPPASKQPLQTVEFPLFNLEDFYKPCPSYRLPVEIGAFSINGTGELRLDRSQLKYYAPPGRLNLDLKVGYSSFVPKKENVPANKLQPILKWISSNGDCFRPKAAHPKSPDKNGEVSNSTSSEPKERWGACIQFCMPFSLIPRLHSTQLFITCSIIEKLDRGLGIRRGVDGSVPRCPLTWFLGLLFSKVSRPSRCFHLPNPLAILPFLASFPATKSSCFCFAIGGLCCCCCCIERLQGVWPKIIPVGMEMPIFYVNFSSLNYPNLNDESLGPYG